MAKKEIPMAIWNEDCHIFREITDTRVGKIIKALSNLKLGLPCKQLDNRADQMTVDRIFSKYQLRSLPCGEEISEKRSQAALKRWHGKANDSDAKQMQSECKPDAKPMHDSDATDTESDTSHTLIPNIPESGSGETFDPKKIDAGEVRYGKKSIVQTLCETLGKGFWKSAITQLGEETVKEEFLTFCSECNAGETVDNAAAAFTSRLGKLGAKTKDGKEVRHA